SLRQYETERVTKDGSRLQVSLSISPLRDSDGRITGAATIARDITERKRAEREREELLTREQASRREAEHARQLSAELLRREQEARNEAETASRLKDEFLANLSHELRTPLNAILGWSRLLRDNGFETATAARGIATIERNATAQNQLINDLLDVSRI